MSHATAIVVVDGNVLESDLENAVQTQIEKYYEYLGEDGYNEENAKWDWWVIGGRWSNNVINTTHTVHHPADPNRPVDWINQDWDENVGGVNIIRKRDLVKIETTLAFVDKAGQWYEQGELGWFGHVANETDPDLWDSAFRQLLEKVDDNDWLVLIDYHI